MRKPIAMTASRKRMNLMGALDLTSMRLTVRSFEPINYATMKEFFNRLKEAYPRSPRIHLILDRGGYNISHETQTAAKKCGIVLPHYLPPYSPKSEPD